MIVIIGSARGDEHGGIKGGQAGDQTGKEVATEKFYKSKLGWRCFRAKDPVVRKKLAYDMKAACANKYIGYDQSDNQSLLRVVRQYDYDCSKVQVYCETDCSSLMRVCILYAGIEIGWFSTADEAEYLLATGAFEEMKGSGYTETGELLEVGDILVTKIKGHTVMVVEVEKDDEYMFTVKKVQSGSKGSSVLLCQELLKVKGYKGKDRKVLTLDGIAGANTVYAINSFQTAMRKKGIECGTNGKNDGICGDTCWKALLGL